MDITQPALTRVSQASQISLSEFPIGSSREHYSPVCSIWNQLNLRIFCSILPQFVIQVLVECEFFEPI